MLVSGVQQSDSVIYIHVSYFLSIFLIISILVHVKWYLVVLIWISLMTNDVEHFSCTRWPYVYLL